MGLIDIIFYYILGWTEAIGKIITILIFFAALFLVILLFICLIWGLFL